MNRRIFIKQAVAAMATTSVVLQACSKNSRQTKSSDGSAVTDNSPFEQMTLRENPNNGDKVSLLGFGMMRLPVEAGGTARENPDSPIDQQAVNDMIDYALEHGVNYFDTSPAYCQGLSERSTGIALSRHPRKDYFIATKLSNFSPETWSEKESKAMFERSLVELKTDYVDYLLLHGIGMSGGGKDAMNAFYGRYMDNGILDWLVEQKKAGRIRNLGFSYHGDIKVFDMLLRWHDEGKYHWDFVQIELNYLDWEYANEINPRNTDAVYLYAELEKRNIPAVIMEPLLGGRLAKQPAAITRKLSERDSRFTPAAWAFRFAGTPKGVLSVLSGMTYLEHLQENVRTYSPLEPLDDSEWTFLLNLARDIYELKAIPCTACNYCMPCPYGLNIPGIFSHYNKCIAEGTMPSAASNENEYQRQRRAFLVGYDRSVPKLRQADHCIGCNHCLSHCPQRIDIPHEMQKINRFVESLKQQIV
ncbi:MAG: aldo/keto reductase [Paludibacteraceae bacterium]|nr:aldo/keto reductase [Paludibacteraceae bacterium]